MKEPISKEVRGVLYWPGGQWCYADDVAGLTTITSYCKPEKATLIMVPVTFGHAKVNELVDIKVNQ